ncbi:hypothetical protein GALMADRAFT_66248 [Galerina marginata CBS 339.88]|uniref:RING-type domain-containing protein n=1 Tax=Galerina marginata (strain CBS 339.88) TaxID=685588 RepID=A0A067T262_GALM3|nr:hypothetical protein GALMADRAFT_66248 [Galerina marginata CBS 339.88]
MTKHSKNNTASSIFTYAEYKKLDYGTKKQRLGNESMRRFDACALCLNHAREPLACHEGHLFCKECVYTDLLTQKNAIKRQKAKIEALKREAEDERTRAREAARDRVLLDFEKGQLGLGISSNNDNDSTPNDQPGMKRKNPSSTLFAFSSSTVSTLAKQAEDVALKKIEEEQAEALKAKLPDFWLPSLTPTHTSGPPQTLEDVQAKMEVAKTVCRGGGEGAAHFLAMKNLIPVNFTFYTPSASAASSSSTTDNPKTKKEDAEPMCPSCKKRLSNSVLLFLSKPCGHVTCKTCTDTLVRPSKQCIVCDVKLKDKDVIELKREGTGFAGGGLAETSKAGIAFQG